MRKGLVSLETRDDGIAGCLRAPTGGSSRQLLLEVRPSGEVAIRFMTVLEYARLQGVPDSFWILENQTLGLQAFGDAVAVPVIAWLGEVLRRHLEHNAREHLQERQVEAFFTTETCIHAPVLR